MTAPERGDLIVIDFDPQAGREQMKRRPALVISPASFNRAFGLAYVVPITTKPKGHGFEVPLPAGLRVKGSVMVNQLKSFDWQARGGKAAGKAPSDVLDRVARIIKLIVS